MKTPEPSNPNNTKITVELHDLDDRGVPTRATIVVNKYFQQMTGGGERPFLMGICEAIRERSMCGWSTPVTEVVYEDQHLEHERSLTIKEAAYWAIKHHADALGDYLDTADEVLEDVLAVLTKDLEGPQSIQGSEIHAELTDKETN